MKKKSTKHARSFHTELLESDSFAQYSLRSTFFVRRLRSMRLWEAIQEVHCLQQVKDGFVWNESDRKTWGIEDDAWAFINDKGIDPLLIFCHPRVISEQPRLLLYYRTVALISQKGLYSLIRGNIAAIESGTVDEVDSEWLQKLVVALNSLASAIVQSSADLSSSELTGFQFASAGYTIQGSWNNAIGDEGEANVKTILLNHLREEITQIVWKDQTTLAYMPNLHAQVIEKIAEMRVMRLKNGFHIKFASEPDISLRDPTQKPLVAAEVKAGADPAGALERLGAAMKSFDNDRNINPRVKTVYIARSLTSELQTRLAEGAHCDHVYSLSALMVDDSTQRRFANLFLRAMLDAQKKSASKKKKRST